MLTKRALGALGRGGLALAACLLSAVVAMGAKPKQPPQAPPAARADQAAGYAAPQAGLARAADPAPFDPDGAAYVLTAWSVSGLKQVSDCDAWFSLGFPLASVRAELIRRDASPELVTRGVTIAYAVEDMAKPSARSRFWEFSRQLAGKALAPDTGPDGQGAAGIMRVDGQGFVAADVPVTPFDRGGAYQPYPTVRLEAREEGTGKVLAVARTTLPVTTQFGCADCHGGKTGAPGISAKTAEAILAAHDRLSKTRLLAEAKAGSPKACASCHEGGAHLALSASLHGFHATKVAAPGGAACVSCHPGGPEARLARDHHEDRGVDCARCHGPLPDFAASLLAQPDVSGPPSAARLLAALPQATKGLPARQAPDMQPDCKACHDFAVRPPLGADAKGKWTNGERNRYDRRADEAGGLACAACHGPAHALYPSHDAYGRYRDSLIASQYQGANAPLGARGNCAVCHKQAMDPATSVHHPIPARSGTVVALPQGATPTKARVLMPHREHAALACTSCHHGGYEDGKGLKCSAAGCHDAFGGSPEDPRNFRNAFHGPKTSCNACHQSLKKAGKPFGPVECGGCHNIQAN